MNVLRYQQIVELTKQVNKAGIKRLFVYAKPMPIPPRSIGVTVSAIFGENFEKIPFDYDGEEIGWADDPIGLILKMGGTETYIVFHKTVVDPVLHDDKESLNKVRDIVRKFDEFDCKVEQTIDGYVQEMNTGDSSDLIMWMSGVNKLHIERIREIASGKGYSLVSSTIIENHDKKIVEAVVRVKD